MLGGRLLDEQGRVVLDQGGFAEWLERLREAKNEPNVIFYNDEIALGEAFGAGDLSYYACFADAIPALQAALGKDKVGVVPLPGEPNRPAGPFIGTTALLFSRASARTNTDLAVHVAKFLTNVQQQTRLAVETESHIPANAQVRIDERLSPIVAALVTQSKTAVAIPLDFTAQADALFEYAEILYNRVMEGEMEPRDAAVELTQKINRELGFE